ncbi:uncharacterized protein BCR38DRAFT_460406 [Pseudomassariella vexata]|uniref:BZIP domain-containing protein n=1 Tax=Pseudomassariella vexata TaxID=1141098 RepID=A0A1Y2DKF7_9PEZI|nr:uncharacterized protein BCR38DRAFT_460406 [Pseudomassariella vexata]ORY59760.1 hypothetical protein BCR38DRAFT_460406 [Pseudomassariella vexata]
MYTCRLIRMRRWRTRDKQDDWTGVTAAVERRKRQNRLHQRAWRKRKLAQTSAGNPCPEWLEHTTHQPIQIANLRPMIEMPLVFPLSSDYQLITIIQFNVLRVMIINMTIPSVIHCLPTACSAILHQGTLPPAAGSIPPSLQPTRIQREVPHDLWIDIVPIAQLRDNLMMNTGKFDTDDLCDDMIGGLYEGHYDAQARGLIVWRDPWDESGWEISDGFAEKWDFLLKGCEVAVVATNQWRTARGEEPLVIEV